MSMITLAVLTAVGLDAGCAKANLEKTIAMMMFAEPPLDGSCGSRSICMISSSPKPHSSILMSSGVIC